MDIPDDDLRACLRTLRAIEADRSHLTRLTREQRRELVTLAGLVAKPERHDLVRMAKAFRRAEREAAREQDRKSIEQAGLRVQRRSPVYAPLPRSGSSDPLRTRFRWTSTPATSKRARSLFPEPPRAPVFRLPMPPRRNGWRSHLGMASG
jgi:hypothetical protein